MDKSSWKIIVETETPKEDNNISVKTKNCLRIEEFGASDILALMDIYLTEWRHRDELLWKQVYKYFYATLIIILLPQLTQIIKIDIPGIPAIVFGIVGLIMSGIFTLVSVGYAKRLTAIGETYQNLINCLPRDPVDLRRISIEDPNFVFSECRILNRILNIKVFNKRMSVILAVLMSICLIVLSIGMIVFYASHPAENTEEAASFLFRLGNMEGSVKFYEPVK